jgi:hypothetical protein
MKERQKRYKEFLSNQKPFVEFIQEICKNSKKAYFPLSFMIERKIKGEYIIGRLGDVYRSPNPQKDYISYKLGKRLSDMNIPNDWSIRNCPSDEYTSRLSASERARIDRFIGTAAIDFPYRGEGYFFPEQDRDLHDLVMSYTCSLRFAKIYTEHFTPDVPILKKEYRYQFNYCKKSFFGRILTVEEHSFYLESNLGRLNFFELMRFQEKTNIKFEESLEVLEKVQELKKKEIKKVEHEYVPHPNREYQTPQAILDAVGQVNIIMAPKIIEVLNVRKEELGSEDFARLRLEHTQAIEMHRSVELDIETYIRNYADGRLLQINETQLTEFINLINNPPPESSEEDLEFFF